jgi:hypothetical protein
MTPISPKTIRALFLGASLVAMPAAYAEAAPNTPAAAQTLTAAEQKFAEQLDGFIARKDELAEMPKAQAVQLIKSIEYAGAQVKPLAGKAMDALKSIAADKNLPYGPRQLAATNIGTLAGVQKDMQPQAVAFLKDQLADPAISAASAEGVYIIASKNRNDRTYVRDAFESFAKAAVDFNDGPSIRRLLTFPRYYGREYSAPLVGVFKSLAENGSPALTDSSAMNTIYGIVSRDPALLRDGKQIFAASIEISRMNNQSGAASFSSRALQSLMAIEAGVKPLRP